MEARLLRAALIAAAAVSSLGASYRTQNFISTAPTAQLAQEIGDWAERYRRDLSIEWLGAELPAWPEPCPISSQVGPHLGAGGATSFMFDRNRPFGWTMSIQGSRERILDSVLPHEITHTIFATHFGRPLPRWADEGACTTVEHESEKDKQKRMLITFLTSGRGIAFNRMFAMKEYPRDVMPLYAQGYSLARYLIAQGGKPKFVEYVGDGMDSNNWTAATKKHYGFESLSQLQVTWLDWVRQGGPPVQPQTLLAANDQQHGTNGLRQAVADGAVAPGVAANNEPVRGAPMSRGNLVPVPSHDTVAKDEAGTATTFASFASASKSSTGGWYARQRDLALARGSDASRSAGRDGFDTGSFNPRGGVGTDGGAIEQSVTRPQPIGRPQQVILEWSRSSPAPATPMNASAGAAPPNGSYGAAPSGTVWR